MRTWNNKEPQEWFVVDDYALMHITKHNGVRYQVLASISDIPLLSKHRWCLNNYGYAMTTKKKVLMHRMVLNAKKDQEVDHKNRQSLDNRRENIRFCTRGQNLQNNPLRMKDGVKIKGVWFDKNRINPYQAYIDVNKTRIHLGRFSNMKDAGLAYDAAAIEYFGEFACTNKLLGLV